MKRNGTRTTSTTKRAKRAGPPKGPARPTLRPAPTEVEAEAGVDYAEILGAIAGWAIDEGSHSVRRSAGPADPDGDRGIGAAGRVGTNQDGRRTGGRQVTLSMVRFAAALGIA